MTNAVTLASLALAAPDGSQKGGIQVPVGTTAQRPTNASTGTLRINTDISSLPSLEVFVGASGWTQLSVTDGYITLPVTSGLTAWYDSSYMLSTNLTSVAGYISSVTNPPTWFDRSGNGNHLTLATNGARWDPGIRNGRGAVYFDGTATYTRNITRNSVNEVTSFIVYRDDKGSPASVAAWNAGFPYIFNWYNNGNGGGRRWETGPGPIANGSNVGVTSNWYVAGGRHANGANLFNWQWSAGYSFATTGTGPGGTGGTYTLTMASYAGVHVGYIAELIVFERYLSDAEFASVYNWLRGRWLI
jgi:hypothetical protein